MTTLTVHQVRQRATTRSFERGEGYYASGVVNNLTLRDNTLQGYVQGSEDTPCHVIIIFHNNGIASTSCTCPYDGDGDCEHIIAVLLTHIRQNSKPVKSPDDILAEMSADQLRDVIHKLRSQKPELEDWLRVILPGLVPKTAPHHDNAPSAPTISVDTRAFRRQVKEAVNRLDYRNHWQSIWNMVSGLDDAQAQASTFLTQGDFNTALILMRILGEEVAPQYGELEEECQLADFLDGWSEELAEAILGADLSPEERQTLSDQLDEWRVELSDYGLDETLDKPTAACIQGWGNASSDLTNAKLNVILYQGDDEKYLAGCLVQDAHYRYALRLSEMGRVDEAVSHVQKYPLRVQQYEDEYLHLGRFLYEQGHTEAAFKVGMIGLDRQNPPEAMLAQWLAELAEETGRMEVAFRAWQTAFEGFPSLDIYTSLKRLAAEDQWDTLRLQLITQVEATPFKNVLIEILIEGKQVERAIEVWKNAGYGSYELREKIVNAAAATHPDWAVEQALAEALYLINKGSKYYPKAVRWLERINQIYRQHNREADWYQCMAEIRAEHGRKYALMGQLKTALAKTRGKPV